MYDSGDSSDDDENDGKSMKETIEHDMKNRKDLLSKSLKKNFQIDYKKLTCDYKRDLENFELIGKDPLRGNTQFDLTRFYTGELLKKKIQDPDKPFSENVYKMKFHFLLKDRGFTWDNETGKWEEYTRPSKQLVEHPEYKDISAWTDCALMAADGLNTWEHTGTKWIKVLSSNEETSVHMSIAEYAKLYCEVQNERLVYKCRRDLGVAINNFSPL